MCAKECRFGAPCRWKLLPEVFLGILYANTKMHNIFLCRGQPEYLFDHFLLFIGQDQFGEELLNIFTYLGSQKNLCKHMHYMFGLFWPLQINHVCEDFPPHGVARGGFQLAATLSKKGPPPLTFRSSSAGKLICGSWHCQVGNAREHTHKTEHHHSSLANNDVSHCNARGSVNGDFHTVLRVWCGNQVPNH